MVKRKQAMNPKTKKIIIYIITVLFAVAYIYFARSIALQGYPDWQSPSDDTLQVKVVDILSDTKEESTQTIIFEAEVLQGDDKGDILVVEQIISADYYPQPSVAQVDDKILVFPITYSEDASWSMLDYVRSNMLMILGLAFAAALLVFGRLKGLNTLISLVFTGLAIFMVFIPAVLSGQNIYIWAMVTCTFVIIMTMLFITGAGKKGFAAGAGCFVGVILAGLLTLLMSQLMQLTGMISEETLYLQLVQVDNPINLRGLVFAAIIIGALGAIMDVAMDIASSLNEMRLNIPGISSKKLISSGMNIGRDVMGTMANTLVLAYIGSGLITTLLLVAYNISFIELMNMELIVVEILQALVGSIGILLAIPMTALICAAIYPNKEHGISN